MAFGTGRGPTSGGKSGLWAEPQEIQILSGAELQGRGRNPRPSPTVRRLTSSSWDPFSPARGPSPRSCLTATTKPPCCPGALPPAGLERHQGHPYWAVGVLSSGSRGLGESGSGGRGRSARRASKGPLGGTWRHGTSGSLSPPTLLAEMVARGPSTGKRGGGNPWEGLGVGRDPRWSGGWGSEDPGGRGRGAPTGRAGAGLQS